MNSLQRINRALTGVLMLLMSACMLIFPYVGAFIVIAILTVSLVLSGCRRIFYYATLARNMVGGWRILFQGVIILDIGIFTMSFNSVNTKYIMLYLIAVNFFNAAVDILKAFEAKRVEAPSWRWKLMAGLLEAVLAAVGLLFLNSVRVLMLLYCVGLIYSGIVKLISAFQRNEDIRLAAGS